MNFLNASGGVKKLGLARHLDATFELVNQVVGTVEAESAVESFDRLSLVLEWECAPEVLWHDLILEIRLSIKVLGLNVGHTLVIRAMKKHHVSREESILLCKYEVSNLDLAPSDLLKLVSVLVEAGADGIILVGVLAVTTVVLITILDHRNGHHEKQRWQHGGLTA